MEKFGGFYMKPFIIPVDTPFKITSDYGYRPVPNNPGKTELHSGIDFVQLDENNNPMAEGVLLACYDGIIGIDFDGYIDALRWTKREHSVGNYFLIKHELNGSVFFTRYFHVKENFVSIGEKVSQGQSLGIYSDVGFSFGGHLHFEVLDAAGNKINPREFLPL
jgi:murein DD-endopeptidase MepM/ murein hydrolase activator NlpD